MAVQEILRYLDRLGITEVVAPSFPHGSVRHLVRQGKGVGVLATPPLPNSLLILLPEVAEDTQGDEGNGDPFRSPSPNIACLALPGQRIGPGHRQFAERTKIPVFSSCFDDSLLQSRLIGLLRERGRRQIMVHGVLVQVHGFGILLLGKSGIGKTACALALMDRGHAWVADDAVVLEGRGRAVYGQGHPRTRGWIAVRGRGLLRAADLFSRGRLLRETRIDLLVRLSGESDKDGVLDGEPFPWITGVPLPCKEIEAVGDPGRMADRVTEYVRSLSRPTSVFLEAAWEQPGMAGANRTGRVAHHDGGPFSARRGSE